MPRNLIRRVEIVFPIEEESLKKKADYILKTQLSDTMKAQCLQSDGSYQKVDRRGKQRIEAQRIFCRDAREASQKKEEVSDRRFVPGKAP